MKEHPLNQSNSKAIFLDEQQQMQSEIICTRIAEGESLVKILEEDKCLPSYAEVRRWLKYCDDFIYDYRTAKRDSAEYIYAEIRDIEQSMQEPAFIQNPKWCDEFDEILRLAATTVKRKGRKKKGEEHLPDAAEAAANLPPKYIPNPKYISTPTGQALIRSLQWRAERMNREDYGLKGADQDIDDGSLATEILEARKRAKTA